MNLIDLFEQRVQKQPHRIALICAETHITYAELLARSAALAQRLACRGLRPGDAVLPVVDFGISLYVCVLALLRLGVVAVFPEPSSGIRGLRAAAQAIPIHALVGDWRRHVLRLAVAELRGVRTTVALERARTDLVLPAVDLPADAPALITFTSGSTGRPKGVVRSHGFLLEQHQQVSAVLQPGADAISLVALPMFILSNLANGVTSVVPDCDVRNPGACAPSRLIRQIERHCVTSLVLPPALCERLAASHANLPYVRQVFTGGGPVFPALLGKLSMLAPNARITAVYGSTEAEPIAHVSVDQIAAEDFVAMRHGAGLLAGEPVQGIGIRIVNDEIWVSGAHVVSGYLNPADDVRTKLEVAGRIWHRTGDAGRIDVRGRLWLLGRHEARSGGLFPFAVETAARCVPGVRNAALLKLGETPVLTVECEQNAGLEFPAGWTRQWCESLRVVRVPRIPMDRRHHSKVDYGRLREMLRFRGLSALQI